MKIEPVNEKQIDALIRCIGMAGAMVCGLGEVDLTRGRGILDDMNRCLWTKDKKRITVTVASDGGIITSLGKEVDPECPETMQEV
jgi:hypothetical protein